MLSVITILVVWIAVQCFGRVSLNVGVSLISLATMLSLVGLFGSFGGSLQTGYFLSVDTLGMVLILVTVWVSMLMYLTSVNLEGFNSSPVVFGLSVSVLAAVVILFFSTDNLLLFYILFESSLLPTLLLVLNWGYQPERIRAGTYFMMYTVCASLPLLVGLVWIVDNMVSQSLNCSYPLMNVGSSGHILGLCFVTAFLVKIPIWGAHLWLPKAHVEAPISGSIILAGVLLKLGSYGLFNIYVLINSISLSVWSFVISVAFWGAVMTSFTCVRQADLKALIAYSSVVHMALVVVGIFSGGIIGMAGAFVTMVAHGVSSPGLFVMANYNYEISGSRSVGLQGGLIVGHPVGTILWFVLLASNIAAPPTLNLAGELILYTGALKVAPALWWAIIVVTLIAAAYNLYMYAIQQGNLNRAINPSLVVSSNHMLVGWSHVVPVYLMTLVLCFYLL